MKALIHRILPYFRIKKAIRKLSLNEQADGYLQFTSKFTRGYVDKELNNVRSVFKDVDRERFLHERLIVIFWLIDKFISDPEHKLTAAIHEKYFKLRGIIDNKEEATKEVTLIMSRYKEYYSLWDNKTGTDQQFLAAAIAKNILGAEKPLLNAHVTFDISIDLALMIKALTDFAKKMSC